VGREHNHIEEITMTITLTDRITLSSDEMKTIVGGNRGSMDPNGNPTGDNGPGIDPQGNS
jgi:hypothetical protein